MITFGAGHFYISQSDKGGLVFGGGLDGWNSYAQRGNLPVLEHVWTAGVAMMPALSRLRGLRNWGGVMDMTLDGSPIIGPTPIDGLTMTAGLVLWRVQGDAGFRLVPCVDDRQGEPHKLNAAFTLDRFREGPDAGRTRRRSVRLAAVGDMIRIDCPWCGPRDEIEFTYRGDATRARPAADAPERGISRLRLCAPQPARAGTRSGGITRTAAGSFCKWCATR